MMGKGRRERKRGRRGVRGKRRGRRRGVRGKKRGRRGTILE